MPHTLHLGDCLDILRTMPDNSVDAVVTDPPYGLSFMGKRWDYDVPSEDIWRECLRVLKPGGHLLAFAGTRTQHRMAVRIEDAGFEIRDMIAWVYGSGFPKSLDVSKAIDKAAGAERKVVGQRISPYTPTGRNESPDYGTYNQPVNEKGYLEYPITAPATPAARQWHGWGTALKPALEPITVARKPLIVTVAENVLAHGTGAINIDRCRVRLGEDENVEKLNARSGGKRGFQEEYVGGQVKNPLLNSFDISKGRWPANLIHDGSEEATELLWDAQRFFYCAKASKRDRDEGCEGMEERNVNRYGEQGQGPLPQQTPRVTQRNLNHHPTVKPTDLMRYLCRLVTPPEGTVLDPFMGSGSTGKAAVLEGFNFIGIEREPEYLEIARARITHAQEQKESRLI